MEKLHALARRRAIACYPRSARLNARLETMLSLVPEGQHAGMRHALATELTTLGVKFPERRNAGAEIIGVVERLMRLIQRVREFLASLIDLLANLRRL